MANSTQSPPQPPQTYHTGPAVPVRRNRVKEYLSTLRLEVVLLFVLVSVGLVAHGLNMFNYPAFTYLDDEGIFSGQAWAVLTRSHLAPYTYIYDNPPAGWLMLAGWLGLTGGLHNFGGAIDGGRVLMLLLHLAMIPLLYQIVRKLGGSSVAAAGATLLFSLSPLAIFYQRLVLIDTIMLFWVLLSLDLLLDGWGRLSRVIFSGFCFGMAVLCHLPALILLPGMLFIGVQQRWKHQGGFAVVGWLLPMLVVASWYPMYALLKGELWSSGLASIPGAPATPRVSLFDTLIGRAIQDGGGLLNYNNQFWEMIRTDWIGRDAFLLVGGALAVVVNLRLAFHDRRALAAALLGGLPLLFLARGGVVLSYDILIAIPFLCLNLALVWSWLVRNWPRSWAMALSAVALALVVGGYWLSGSLQPLFQERPAQAGREALSWIKQNVPAQSYIISRDDLWTDLQEPGQNEPAFPNVHPHYKVGADPEVRYGVFKNDWKRVDYLVLSPELKKEFVATKNQIALDALENSHLVRQWTASGGNPATHKQQIVELWKVDKPSTLEREVLADSSAYLKARYEQNGAFTTRDRMVTSEAQANALLRAVWQNDQPGFKRSWDWSRRYLQNADGLQAWLWQNGAIRDSNTASDADTSTALALLMAGKRWNDPALLDAGKAMVQAIWKREVVLVNNKPYLAAGDWAAGDQRPLVALNPGYFAPYAYRVFKEVDPAHDWQGLIEAGYQMLFDASAAPLGTARSAGLPPDWIGLNRESGELVALQLDKNETSRYGYDAPRSYWRVALDLRWSGDGRARSYLQQAGFLRDEVTRLLEDKQTRKGRVSAVYTHDGKVIEENPSLVGTAGAMAALLTLDPAAANTIYARQILGGFSRNSQGIYWGDGEDLSTQDWGWFATALYAGALPDLWKQPPSPPATR